jgi:hypothetical protein
VKIANLTGALTSLPKPRIPPPLLPLHPLANPAYTRLHAWAVRLVLGSPNRDRSGGRRHHTADRLVAETAAPVETGGGMFGPVEWPTVVVLGVALVVAVVVAIGLPRRKRPPRS